MRVSPAGAEFEISLAGGDTNSWDGPLVISVTALGENALAAAVPRWCTARRRDCRHGPVRRQYPGPAPGLPNRGFTRAIALHTGYESLHAGIDVSDGLTRDLGHLLEESGVGAVVDLPAVPIHPSAEELATRQGDGRRGK